MNCCPVDSPIGTLLVYANGEDTALVKISFGGTVLPNTHMTRTPLLAEAAKQLEEYFEGRRKQFDLPLAPQGTPFQQACWQALCDIPYGRTHSYADQAKAVGNLKASRAVGMANNRNPLPILIPCHRVVGIGGKLVGYAGGLEIKEKLLALEAANSSWIEFDKKELNHLCKADPALAKVIKAIPTPDYELFPDLFTALVRNILAQQISGKAFATVWERAQHSWGSIIPKNIVSLNEEQLCSVGISSRKADYVRSAALAFADGTVDPQTLAQMEDEEVISCLCALKGVGRWTAEMLLMFSLGRRNVLSFGDFGIRRGLCRIHNLAEEDLTKERFEHYRRLYSPCGTVASLYLWAAGNSQNWPPHWTGWQE